MAVRKKESRTMVTTRMPAGYSSPAKTKMAPRATAPKPRTSKPATPKPAMSKQKVRKLPYKG